eukprot:GILI01011493.1.p1 GENE.GILI01011493.1~~GILI01011493.1.p1  ORF type:complete len:110 (-),score=22.33 GILI01011493.1:486-782(-)
MRAARASSVTESESQEGYRGESSLRVLWGYALLLFSIVFFFVSMYALVFSKLLPATGHHILDWIARDWYYCLLIPLLIPTTVIAAYVNWVSMKFFRHN